MPRVKSAAHTLGCKVNQYETDKLLEGLSQRGYKIVSFSEEADIYIVNTCAVTHTGEAKSLQILRRAKNKNPNATIAACGCLARLKPEAIKKAGADIVFDAREPDGFYSHFPQQGQAIPFIKKRTRATVKIQDGCDRFCAYCVVPYARGGLNSRPAGDILREAETLLRRGVREIVLTGIQAAAYGKDKAGIGFSELIRQVAALPGLTRLRLGSIEPYAVDEAFLDACSSPVVCPHFHLSLQSGCDNILQAMNRRYSAEQYAQAAKELQQRKPDTAITTDIMAGFPGETDEDFYESLRFAEAAGFAGMHVFIYSPRDGTPAAKMPGQVPHDVKTARGKQMRELAEKLQNNFLRRHTGQIRPVLFESIQNGLWEGHTDNYIQVRIPSEKDLGNQLCGVQLETIKKGIFYGGLT